MKREQDPIEEKLKKFPHHKLSENDQKEIHDVLMKSLGNHNRPQKKRQRHNKWFAGLASAAALVIVVVLGISLFTNDFDQNAGGNNKEESKSKEPAVSGEENKEVIHMSVSDIRLLVEAHLDEIEDRMYEIANEHYSSKPNHTITESILEPTNDSEEDKKLVANTMEVLTDLIIEDKLEEMARLNLYGHMYTYGFGLLKTSDIDTRFEVIEQTEDSFEVSFLTLATEIEDNSSTVYIKFIKRDNKWIYADHNYIIADEKPFNLTFEDLKSIYKDSETDEIIEGTLVDKIEFEGERFIVMKYNDFYEARNVKTSILNFELSEKYK